MLLLVAATSALSLSACKAVVQNKVETALVDAGVPAGMAGCMAPIWANKLSVEQIRGIQNFATNVRVERGRLTVGRLLEYVRKWNDPQALTVVTTSAARCALR
jgi:hypothetical protein